MNKAQLINALAERLGDKKIASAAVAGLIDLIVRTVDAGERVTITGFGVFEKRARAARTARNPRTGQAVAVQQTAVPAFRPGILFREVVSGTRVLPESDGGGAAEPRPTDGTDGSNSRPAPPMTDAHMAPASTPKKPKTGKTAKADKLAKTARNSVKAAAKKAGKKADKK